MPTHAEQRLIAYTPDQLFDLVADVEKYPQFLPWCVKASIRTQTEQELVADLTIGFGPFRETFTSRVTLERPSRIRVRYEKGPFRYLNNVWTFSPDPRGCLVDFFVDFEFKSRLLQNAMGVVFNEGVRLMVSAFIKRARDIYGAQGAKAAPSTPGLSQRT
ncbi:type II toxin-antitoxin system RatA family toxin [Gluconobacter sp. LMG 1744]|uniref:type II toxin-antitoxin system RatA family toxin n=1 Tax=Gluconobacter cadivus TaxID=2728101 RepID=UPI001884CD66|nr:type II toxin-antitoxin system RatA family toxin [Gluconobacter cadivus]MBF0892143.1 type II toxin-antitoxin system RatA family toxin [Gluconobacter cadivus]